MTTVLPGEAFLALGCPRPVPPAGKGRAVDVVVPLPLAQQPPRPQSSGRQSSGRHRATARTGTREPATGKAPSRTGELLLTLAALLGIAVTVVTVFAATTGLQPLVVQSGSMEPTIATGAMVLVRTVSPADIEVGDVVAVERPDRTRVMHRVLEVTQQGATAELVLKGDANEDADPVPVTVAEAGELVFSTPLVGRMSSFLTSAKGGFILGSLVTAVLMLVLRRRTA